jgi:hypothetical protein
MQGSAHVHDEHFSTDSGTIEQLCRASAEICVVLESQAIVGVGIESDAAVKVLLTAPAAVADPSPSSNQQRVDAFLRQASRKHGERLPENYIWKTLCNYKDDTRFRQWKQGKLNPRARAARAFEKVVSRAADLLKD